MPQCRDMYVVERRLPSLNHQPSKSGPSSAQEGNDGNKSGEEISLFIRDEQTGRFLFNAGAMKALDFDPARMQERGYFVEGAARGAGDKGGKPVDLPVQAPTNYETVLNMKTARSGAKRCPVACRQLGDKRKRFAHCELCRS
jgi:hypothetical protein